MSELEQRITAGAILLVLGFSLLLILLGIALVLSTNFLEERYIDLEIRENTIKAKQNLASATKMNGGSPLVVTGVVQQPIPINIIQTSPLLSLAEVVNLNTSSKCTAGKLLRCDVVTGKCECER